MGPFSPLWPVLLPSLSLRPTVDTMATVDTADMVDTMVDTVATTEARGPLMPNLRPKLMPLPNPKLMLNLGAMDIMAIPTDTDTTAIPTVISAKDLLMPNLRLRPNPGEDIMADTTAVPTVITDTDTVILARGPLMPKPKPNPNLGDTTAVDTDMAVTMVDTVDTIMVELLKTPLKLPSGSSHSNSFNLATIPSIF